MTRIFLKITIISVLLSLALQAKNYAVLIHGFGGDQTSWNNETINGLQSGKIDDVLNIAYDVSQIKIGTTSGDSYIYNTFIQPMLDKNPTSSDQWVLIGHSLGGLIARALDNNISENVILSNQLNIVAVLSINTPHQGTRVSYVSAFEYYDDFSNYGGYNPEPIMADFRYKIRDAIENGGTTYWDNLIRWYDPQAYMELQNLPNLLDDAWETGKEYIVKADNANAYKIIGRSGSAILEVNSTTTTTLYRSMYSAEKHPVALRYATTFDLTDLNEDKMKENYSDVKTFFANQAGHNGWVAEYNSWCCWWWDNGCCRLEAKHKALEKKWRTAKAAWDGIDNMWGQIINSFEVSTEYRFNGYKLNCEDIYGYWNQDIEFDWDVFFRPAACTGNWDQDWEPVYVPYYVVTSEKNDGLVRPRECLWKKNDSWTPDSRTTMFGQNNYYYPDAGIEPAGYNHNEMKNYIRQYSPGMGGISVPWQDVNIWLRDKVGL